MLESYLGVRRSCASCGEALYHHRADDMPAWAVVLIVGKVLIGTLVAVEVALAPPAWVHWAIWPALTLLMTLWLLPRVKGTIVAFQWATRMHGFAGSPDDDR